MILDVLHTIVAPTTTTTTTQYASLSQDSQYHSGVAGRCPHEGGHGVVQLPEQLGIDGHLEEAVEVLAVREAEEAVAVATAGQRHGEPDGVEQQLHQGVTLGAAWGRGEEKGRLDGDLVIAHRDCCRCTCSAQDNRRENTLKNIFKICTNIHEEKYAYVPKYIRKNANVQKCRKKECTYTKVH